MERTPTPVLCVVFSRAVVFKVWPWPSTMDITWELQGASFSGPTHLLNQNPWEWSWVECTIIPVDDCKVVTLTLLL